MKDTYVSIAEFAKMAGVSTQAIYKRLDKDLQPYLQLVAEKKLLNIKALELFGATEVATEVTTVELLKKTLEQLEKQLEAKDRQIEQMQTLLDQEQKLHAAASQRLLLLEPPKDDADGSGKTVRLTGKPPSRPDPDPPKRRWWQFWSS